MQRDYSLLHGAFDISLPDCFILVHLCLVQRELDGQAQEVVKRQDDSEVSRKKLVELSREFKRTSTEVCLPLAQISVGIYMYMHVPLLRKCVCVCMCVCVCVCVCVHVCVCA